VGQTALIHLYFLDVPPRTAWLPVKSFVLQSRVRTDGSEKVAS